MKHFLLLILLLNGFVLFGEPLTSHLSPLTSPWLGGLNACQFGRMDLDQDGKKDLLVFDRHGDRLLCFLNKGSEGEIRYEYTSAYDEVFPKLNAWAVFADYDGDGKEDIFTYSKGWAGIKVYRNTSTADALSFELEVSPYLTSWQGGGEVNILATDADYPAIVDLDGDGDLDLLTFGVMGTFIEKHLNLSMERYGCLDSLTFERTDQCWGRVAENDENNVMYLDTCLFGYGLTVTKDDYRHRGATVTIRDMNGDGLMDLLLADVDYPGLTLLINGGDADNALMVSQTDRFPQSYPVQLPSMPVPFFTDINNDGIDDLLVSPFDPNLMASVGKESVWLYLNHGTNEIPDFQLYSKSFLQEQMIDVGKGAYPVFTDWDGDGLLDLKVKDFDGQFTVFKNVGTTSQPAFEQVYEAREGDLEWSAQCYFDVDQDGLADLVEGNVSGKLTYYRGNANGFEWVTDFWGGVDVCDHSSSYFGYSVPTLFYYQDQLLLCVGSEQGKLFLYRVSEDVVFEEVGYLWEEICPAMPELFGIHSAAALADLNGDGVLEVVVGNFAGGLQLYNAMIPVNNIGISEQRDDVEVLIFPNPVTTMLHIISTGSSLRIVDLFGRTVREQEISSSETLLDVSDLPSGVYLLSLTLDCGLVNRIFLKR